MKRTIIFLLFTLCVLSSQAQRKFRFGLGLNYPIPIENGEQCASNLDTSIEETSTLAIVPGVNYLFPLKTKKVLPYVGLGTGISFDNFGKGVFGHGMHLHPVLVPKVGIQFFKHLDVTFRYYITHPDFDRLMVGIGYTF